MGAKVAGIHFLTQEPDKLLPKLKRKFNKTPGPSDEDLAFYKLLRALGEKHLRETHASEEVWAEQMGNFDAILREREYKRAVIVLRPAALSLYWYDQIRTENLGKEAKKYAKSLGLPALGLSLYDDDDVILCATDGKEVQQGFYWFTEEDIEPADPEALCALLGAVEKAPFVAEALQYQDAEGMLQALERIFGVELYLDADACRGRHYKEVAAWGGAEVFREV